MESKRFVKLKVTKNLFYLRRKMTSTLEFINVDQPEGLKKLNHYLEDNSYIVGFSPSKYDTYVIEQLDDCPKDGKYPHISRWSRHIKSFSAKERQAWKTAANISVNVTRLSPKAEVSQDDDFDPFGNNFIKTQYIDVS
jgi:hypothetical protein